MQIATAFFNQCICTSPFAFQACILPFNSLYPIPAAFGTHLQSCCYVTVLPMHYDSSLFSLNSIFVFVFFALSRRLLSVLSCSGCFRHFLPSWGSPSSFIMSPCAVITLMFIQRSSRRRRAAPVRCLKTQQSAKWLSVVVFSFYYLQSCWIYFLSALLLQAMLSLTSCRFFPLPSCQLD